MYFVHKKDGLLLVLFKPTKWKHFQVAIRVQRWHLNYEGHSWSQIYGL
jgi:hypothetical protein